MAKHLAVKLCAHVNTPAVSGGDGLPGGTLGYLAYGDKHSDAACPDRTPSS